MDIAFLVLLALAIPVCAIAGFAVALSANGRAKHLEVRIRALEAQVRSLQAGPAPLAAGGPVEEPEAVSPLAQAAPPGPEPALAEEPLAAPPTSVPPVPPVAPPPAARPGLEERLGARWAVWVGGVALALGGLFLVRYSIEQGLLGPGARVAAGALFALALLAAGEWLRRRETPPDWPGLASARLSSPHVPGVLTAAGASTAFATVYAAHALYGLIGPALAFLLLGAVAILTLGAATLHGPAIGALGLVAALGSPLLVSSDNPQAWPLVLYLAFAVTAAYGVARLRLWRWLALAAAAGAVTWALLFMLMGAAVAPVMAHVLIQLGLAGAFLVADPHRRTADSEARLDRFASAVLLAFAVLVVLATIEPGAGAIRPAFAGAAALAVLGLALRFSPAAPGAALAGLIAAGTLAFWPVAREIASEATATLPGPLGEPRPAALGTYLAFAVLSALAIASASLYRLAQGRLLPFATAAWFAGAATAGPLAILVVAYWRVAHLDRNLSFALAAGLLAAGFVAAVTWLKRQERDELDGVKLALGACASAAVAAVALGLTFALDRGMLTVAFALAALGTAWVADRARIPALRWAVGALGFLVLGRLVWDPTIMNGDPGRTLVFNWLLWGYGVPALSFFLASRLLERSGRDAVVRLAESLAIAFAALLVIVQIRHALHAGDPLAAASDHIELGLIACANLLFALAMVRLDARRPDVVTFGASLVFAALSLLVSAVGLCLVVNPLFTGEPIVGGVLFNSLLIAYLAPAGLALALAWIARESRPLWYRRAALGLGLVLHLLYTVMAIRRVFQGPVVDLAQPTGEAELWAYSAALVLTGVALLAVGLWRDIRIARLASAGYIVAAVAKVFLVDLANLQGVMQALSFIGLGLALVGIGFAYQKLLARGGQPAAPS